jgi:dimethylargininase
MLLALTRPVSPSIVECQLTHLARQPIELARAVAEHAEYERRLAELGATVRRLPAAPTLPDAVFVEDTAVVVDELAVVTRPGAEARRPETAAVAEQLAEYRRIVPIEPPGTLDGGDVLVMDGEVYVGRSTRTNDSGIEQLRRALEPLGYRVTVIAVTRCLHLKAAVTRVAAGRCWSTRHGSRPMRSRVTGGSPWIPRSPQLRTLSLLAVRSCSLRSTFGRARAWRRRVWP